MSLMPWHTQVSACSKYYYHEPDTPLVSSKMLPKNARHAVAGRLSSPQPTTSTVKNSAKNGLNVDLIALLSLR